LDRRSNIGCTLDNLDETQSPFVLLLNSLVDRSCRLAVVVEQPRRGPSATADDCSRELPANPLEPVNGNNSVRVGLGKNVTPPGKAEPTKPAAQIGKVPAKA
jgi:hypothetical protein